MEETVKLLIVDDDEVDRMAVRRALKTAGVQMELLEVDSLAAAIAIIQQQPFDCVFLDYRLPDGDGLSLVEQVRALKITVPLVVLTGQGDEQIAVQVMKAGASDYIPKNRVVPQNLYVVLNQVIRIHRAEIAAAEANEKLKASEERYRLVLEGAYDGIWDWNCLTNEVYCNDRLLEIIGVSRTEFKFTSAAFIELMHPEDIPHIRVMLSNHLTKGEKCETEFRIRHASGEYRYCTARGKAQRDHFGCPVRMSGIISDITERKRLETALTASESRFRRLAEANVIGIILADLKGSILEANDAFLKMVGYTQGDLKFGKISWQEMTPPEYNSADQQSMKQIRTTGAFAPFEKQYIRKNGSRVPVLVGGALVEGLEETCICFVLDLSDRKQSEAEIVKLNRDLERRVTEMQTLLDVIPIGIAIAQDPECSFIRVNPSLAKLLQLPLEANASKSAPPQEQPAYKVYKNGKEVAVQDLPIQYAAKNSVEVLDAELDLIIEPNKPPRKILGYAAPLFDEQGKSRGSIAAFVDITERKRIEEQERFLADASAILAASLDYQTTLENLAYLVAPQFADWCNIYLLDANGKIRAVTIANTNPLQVKWAKNLHHRYPLNPDANYGVAQVIRSGSSELYTEVPAAILENIPSDAELELLREAGLTSAIWVPIKARGRTLGAISLLAAESSRIYTQADLRWAEDLGRRAGLAVDNARLYEEANEIGENLRKAIIILGEQQQQLRVLQRITNLLNQRLSDLPGLLQVMVRAISDGIAEAQFAAIALYNPQTKELELTVTAGLGREKLLLPEFLAPEEGLLNQVFLTGESQLIQGNFAFAPQTNCASIYASAIASVQAGRLGVLAIGSWDNANAFDLEDQTLLAAVGEQAAIAIDNARLINALEEREERLAWQNETLAQQNYQLEFTRQQIERQNSQLIEAARLKSQFLATMSHELRTPMNAVIGFAQVLLRQRTAQLTPQQVDMVERILNNGKNLLALINDILDLSKIEAGRLELQLEEFSLRQLVLTTVAELHPLADQKHLLLEVHTDLDNIVVVNDITRLRQILVNLLSNAIKFTDVGKVEVNVSEVSATYIAIAVKDTGIGIAASELDSIFEEFRQVDQTTTRKHSGTGLGLAITKSLVQMMQGRITVDSTLGTGSTFKVELPRQVSTAVPPNLLA